MKASLIFVVGIFLLIALSYKILPDNCLPLATITTSVAGGLGYVVRGIEERDRDN